MKTIVILFLVSTFLLAEEDLTSLLNTYESQSELHKKTKDESAGHLIIYSRKDLDKMQAQTLDDILKSLRYFTLEENIKGNIGLQLAGASCGNSGCIRMYVNDQEMSSAISGSALMIFGEYDLGHVDHIEVYLGGSDLKLGNEYGFVTIKVYTKEANREKGGFLNASYGTNNSYGLEAFYAGVTDESLEYTLYAKQKDKDLGNITNKNSSVPRYTQSTYFYANVKKENDFTLEISSYTNETDALAGIGTQKTPDVSYIPSTYNYLSFTKYFDKLKFITSYAQEEHGIINTDQNGILFYDKSVHTHYKIKFKDDIFKLGMEHSSDIGNNGFFYGVNYQNKNVNYQNEGFYSGINALEIYSAFLEYSYNFDANNLFLATGKWEHYKHDGYDRSDDLYQRRIGLISLLSDAITFKGFYSHNYIYPSVSELNTFPRPTHGNQNLKPMDVQNYSFELLYNSEQHDLSFMYMQMNIYDPIKIDSTKTYFNKDVHAVFNDYALDYTYKFDRDNKLNLEYYFTKHNRHSDASPASGGFIKFFNTVGSLDFYNELIFREAYFSVANNMNIDNGFDWTSSITYRIDKQFSVALKGENLLDKAIASPVKSLYPVETIDKRVTLYVSWFY